MTTKLAACMKRQNYWVPCENWSLNISMKPLAVMAVMAVIMIQAKSFWPT